MINYKNVQKYIEEKNNIKLTNMQIQILKAIIRGDNIYTARGIGRSILYNGYADYLKDVISKDTDRTLQRNDFDSIFTATTAIEDGLLDVEWCKKMKIKNESFFNKEFNCNF